MTSNEPMMPIPFAQLRWEQDPGGAEIAVFDRNLRLHVVRTDVPDVGTRYLAGVVTNDTSAMQAAIFYARTPEVARSLAYQLGVLISPDFV